jgi:hypothetical protein
MKFSAYIAILVLLVFASCKKELPTIPDSNDPVFSIKGTLNGEKIEFVAGDDAFVMNAQSEMMNGIPFYGGKLSNASSFFEFGLFDGNPDLPIDIKSVLNQVTSLNIADKFEHPLYVISKDKFVNANLIHKVRWSVNGVFKSENLLSIYEPGHHEICGEVFFTDGSVHTLCNTIYLGFKTNGDYKVSYIKGSNNTLKAWLLDQTHPIERVEWFKNGLKISEEEQLNIMIYSQEFISSTVTFENGVKRTRNIFVDGSVFGKFIEDFSSGKQNSDQYWDYKAKFKIKHNGKIYTSILKENASKTISIQSIEFYKKNNAGQSIFKVTASLDAFVMDESSQTIVPLKLDFQVGVALD